MPTVQSKDVLDLLPLCEMHKAGIREVETLVMKPVKYRSNRSDIGRGERKDFKPTSPDFREQ